MQRPIAKFRFCRVSTSPLPLLLMLALGSGCGGSEVDGGAGDRAAASGGSTSAPNLPPSPSAEPPTGSEPAPTAPSSESQNPATPKPAPTEGTRPASTDAAGLSAACAALDTSDACGECVCRECGESLDTCANTPGCAEILACVRENGCSGTDCFCGDTTIARCFAGGADGPCKEAVLSAPGGREPTISDPSGGPASDAALAVGECADEDDRCADVCDVGL